MRIMKKMLLIGMLVVSGLSYGRDYEHREGKEMQVVENVNYDDQSMITREREIGESNMITYSEFHKELDKMDRGTDNR